MHDRIDPSRVFSFGVGQAPNRMLMERMAKIGRGAVSYRSLNDDADNAAALMGLFVERVRSPAMTHVEVDCGPLEGVAAYPRRLPDLFAGRPVIVTGRYKRLSSGVGEIVVDGRQGATRVRRTVPVVAAGYEIAGSTGTGGALRPIWARMKITDMMDNVAISGDRRGRRLEDGVRDLALEHGLMSSFTAFIAVDSMSRTAGIRGTTVPVGVPVPNGVRYETMVGAGG